MTRFTRPDNWQDLLAGYALGDLSPEEAETLQQIFTEHSDLIAEVDRLQEVLALMPYALPENEPPAHLRAKIMSAAMSEQPLSPAVGEPEATLGAEAPSAVQDDQPDSAQSDPAQLRSRQTLRWVKAAGAIAAVVIAGLAIDNVRLRQAADATQLAHQRQVAELQQAAAADRSIITLLQQPNAQLYALEGTPNAALASGSIVLDRQQKQVAMVAQNLPQLPNGQVYRLWAMAKNAKKPAYCGQFNASAGGTVLTRFSASNAVCSISPAQLLITAELATAPPVPQGDLVMKSRV